jgi:hypothetical protein
MSTYPAQEDKEIQFDRLRKNMTLNNMPTQPRIQWVPRALSLEVRRPGREADHSPPFSAEVKNAWSYAFTPQYVFMAWCLVKHGDNVILTSLCEL